MAAWSAFAEEAPELATFAGTLFDRRPAYLATVDAAGRPRAHPVTPVIASTDLFVFMEPTSPKGRDLVEREVFALHNGVPDSEGTGGELWVRGTAALVDDPAVRVEAAAAARYAPADRYILFRLSVLEVRAGGYGDIDLPAPTRWRAP